MGQKLWGRAAAVPSTWQMHLDLAQKVAPRYLFVCPTVGVAASPYKCSQYDISCSPRGQGGDSSTHGSCYISGTRFSMHGRQNFLQHIINGSSSLCSQHTSLLCPLAPFVRIWPSQLCRKIRGTTKQTAVVVIEFLDGVGGRKKEDRSIGGSMAACQVVNLDVPSTQLPDSFHSSSLRKPCINVATNYFRLNNGTHPWINKLLLPPPTLPVLTEPKQMCLL